ncbi:MAG: PAS domain S-box protein [Chloroflexi bacterium]|nr:PAS domain S-box protein [Chloroflexota bacterium]
MERTKTRLVSDQLERGEERYRALFEAAAEAIVLQTADGVILDCNPSACQIFACAREQLIGANVCEFVAPEGAPTARRFMRDALRSGAATFTLACKRRTGVIFPAEVTARRVLLGGAPHLVTCVRDVTERKWAEERIRQDERFLKAVFDGIQDGISVLDKELNIVSVNQAMEKWYAHMTPLVGKKCFHAYHGREAPCTICPTVRAMKTGTPQMDEVPLTGADGVWGWLEVYAFPMLGDDGKPTGAIEYVRDITERKRAEDKIRYDEWFLQAVFDGIQDGISVLDRNMRIVRVNNAMERWYAHATPLVGKLCYQAYHLRSEPCVICPTRRAMEKGTPQMDEIPLTGPKGVEGWLELYAFPMYDDNGNCIGVIEYVRDITKRREAEEALGKSRRLLEKTFASLRDAAFIIDLDMRILDCNPAATEIFGYKRQEMLAQDIGLLHVDGARLEEFNRHLRAALAEKGFLFLPEFPMKHKSGRVFTTEHSVVPLEDEQHRHIGWVALIRDITERKRMEQYMLRTERLAAMGRLAAALAHEINNPLQGIGNSLELVLDFPLGDEERQEYLLAVRREIERLMALSERVLDFARPPQIERRPTLVPPIVQHALDLAANQLQQRRIAVTLDLPADLPPVMASADHLSQVFLNLIINAIEAMPGGGSLDIAARVCEGQMELAFSDTGSGITPEAMSMLFEPFYTTKEDGTGLGLAISHSIIQQHGGSIAARNAPGGGATFIVSLPLAPALREESEEVDLAGPCISADS